jgi:uroporphyrin-3 C-methyltransferase
MNSTANDQEQHPSSAAAPVQDGEAATPTPRPPKRHWHLDPAWAVAVLAVALLAGQWLDTHYRIGGLEQELSKRLAGFEGTAKESQLLSSQAQEGTREALVKLGVLESKLAEWQNQQVALEALYQEMSRSRDEWTLADVEQILMAASQQLQLAGNVKAALIAMQTADSRLQRLDKPQFIALRKAINQDIERLKALPFVDTVGISLQLDDVVATVDSLPLASESARKSLKSAPEPAPQEGPLARFGREAWSELKQLVQVRKVESPDAALLTPSQTYFLRENLKLRLLAARLALLQHDEATYRADIKAAQGWVRQYFNSQDRATRGVLTTLHQLSQSAVSIQMPDITASLAAVRDYRGKREGGRE